MASGEWYDELAAAVAEARQAYLLTRDPRVRADLARATADTLHLAARALGDQRLEQAADLFGRAAREPYRCTPAPTRYGYALRRAARVHALDAARRRRPDPLVAVLHLLAALIDLVQTIAEMLQAQHCAAQSAAARNAADRLTAVRAALGQPRPSASARPRPKSAAALAAGDFPAGAAVTRRRTRGDSQPVAQPIRPAQRQGPGTERGPRL